MQKSNNDKVMCIEDILPNPKAVAEYYALMDAIHQMSGSGEMSAEDINRYKKLEKAGYIKFHYEELDYGPDEQWSEWELSVTKKGLKLYNDYFKPLEAQFLNNG